MKYQEFLVGRRLIFCKFTPDGESEHEHCNMCGAKFSINPGDLHIGYRTDDSIGWVCPECYDYYKDEYDWTVMPKAARP